MQDLRARGGRREGGCRPLPSLSIPCKKYQHCYELQNLVIWMATDQGWTAVSWMAGHTTCFTIITSGYNQVHCHCPDKQACSLTRQCRLSMVIPDNQQTYQSFFQSKLSLIIILTKMYALFLYHNLNPFRTQSQSLTWDKTLPTKAIPNNFQHIGYHISRDHKSPAPGWMIYYQANSMALYYWFPYTYIQQLRIS